MHDDLLGVLRGLRGIGLWAVLLLVLVATFLLASLIAGLVLLILFVVRSFGAYQGGWRRLLKEYLAPCSAQGQVHRRQTLKIGAVVYKRCVTVGIADEGFYLNVWRKTVRIPWQDFKRLGQATLYWQKVPMLTVGEPPLATITVPLLLFESMRSRLPDGLLDAK